LLRAIKLYNILLDGKDNVRIAYFRASKYAKQREVMRKYCGTSEYITLVISKDRRDSGFKPGIWNGCVVL
jgi:hypothetical protein